jgi:hypothetical protein
MACAPILDNKSSFLGIWLLPPSESSSKAASIALTLDLGVNSDGEAGILSLAGEEAREDAIFASG